MNKTIIIVLIAVLSVAALCLGVYIAILPEPVEPAVYVDPFTDNSLIAKLGIERPNNAQERLIAIKTYQDKINVDDLLKIAEVGGLEYYELDPDAKDYLLIVPFEIGGKMTIYDLAYDEFNETYSANNVVHPCNGGEALPDNYALLLKYTRPSKAEYQIDLVQESTQELKAAAYQFTNRELVDKVTNKYAPVKTLQFVKEYIEGDSNPDTESFGVEIKIPEEQ